LRHPWRLRQPRSSPTTHLRAHAALAAATGVLVAGHIAALSLDRYAGVGWTGAFVPGQSTYRTAAVAIGTVALYAGVLVGGTAALAGRLFRRAWLPIHRLAAVTFILVWGHAVLAGSDTPSLRAVYGATGALVLGLALSRRLARPRAVDGSAVTA
jgi:DMSO/TMAO reductase YedYZ heme-binding membrane subunit